MDIKIVELINRGRVLAEKKQQEEEAALAAKIKLAKESWAGYSSMLRKLLPEAMQDYMKPLTGARDYDPAPERINGYEYAKARIEADETVRFQLPGLDTWSGKPRATFEQGSSYYGENDLPLLMFDAAQIMHELNLEIIKYEAQRAEAAARETQATESVNQAMREIINKRDPEYVPVDKENLTVGEILINDLRGIVREIVREELASA